MRRPPEQPPERLALLADPTVPPSYRRQHRRAMEGTCSPRAAIKAKCLECSCFQRVEIANCAVLACPLWLFRPYVNGQPG